MTSRYGTVEEAAEYLKIPKDTMYEIVKIKDFPSAKVGKHWRIRMDKIDEWWEKRWSEKEDNIK